MEGFEDDRYSRQIYSIGKDLMSKIKKCNVLIIGYSPLSLEIIKNLMLTGVKSIDVCFTEGIVRDGEPVKKKRKFFKTVEESRHKMYYELIGENLPLRDISLLNPSVSVNQISFSFLNIDKNLQKYSIILGVDLLINCGIKYNRIARDLNIPFIMCGSLGLMGWIFNDFGKTHHIYDSDGEIYEYLYIELIDNAKMTFKEKHNLSDGDTLIIKLKTGEQFELIIKKTITPYIIEFNEKIKYDIDEYETLIKKKAVSTVKFKPLHKNIGRSMTTIFSDSSVPENRTEYLHKLHLYYNNYLIDNHPIRAWSTVDFENFTTYISDWESCSDEFKLLAKKFTYTLSGQLLAIDSIIGGIVSQEVIKSLGKYIPIKQWYYMDYYELLNDETVMNHVGKYHNKYRVSKISDKSIFKYEPLINIFGKDIFEKIQKSKPFVIGTGAIGCELLKNLAMCGVSNIVTTDMDYIEKSNLSRQFLFSDNDIHKSKSVVASQKIKIMNEDVTVTPYELKLCKDIQSETFFNSTFHSNIDIYLNALDNKEARLYVDSLSIKYEKPLIDSGTLGTQANLQVVIPHITESYGSSKDVDETKNIPMCTIKSFPFKAAHTIQWGRELFETECSVIPSTILKYYGKNIETLNISPPDLLGLYKQLYKWKNFDFTEDACHTVLSHIFVENYIHVVNELLINKYKDKENMSKKYPSHIILEDVLNKKLIKEFFITGFNIFSQLFEIPLSFNKTIHGSVKSSTISQNHNILNNISDFQDVINTVGSKIKPLLFDKDNDDVGHVRWLTCMSNLRNIQYEIEMTDVFNTRIIAGKIIPAVVTCTSVIAGFQILEYIKLVIFYKKHDPYFNYKNRFVNLDVGYIDGIEPVRATQIIYKSLKLSLWSKIHVKHTHVNKIVSNLEKMFGEPVSFMTQNGTTLYDGSEILVDVVDFTVGNISISVGESEEVHSVYY